MVTTLIVGGSENLRREKAFAECDLLSIHALERYVFDPPLEKASSEDTYGIGLVRKIKQKALLKPAYSLYQAILLFEAERLTLPAQHALLKLLEEPPEHTIIVLSADSEHSLLATIRSRCFLIKIKKQEKPSELPEEFLPSDGETIGNRLLLAEKLAKSDPKKWIIDSIHHSHTLLLQKVKENDDTHETLSLAHRLTSCLEIYEILTTTNVNQRLALEHFLLSL